MPSQKELDPELAALLGADDDMDSELASLLYADEIGDSKTSDFMDIFNEDKSGQQAEPAVYPEVTRRYEETPHDFFNDPGYYKTALSEEGEVAHRVHGILQKYLAAKDPKDRSVFRQQFIKPYWDFLLGVAKSAPGKIPQPKKFLLRFAILHPTLIRQESREYFSKLIIENELNQTVYYMDEWLKAIGTGALRPSTTDEAKIAQSNISAKLQQMLERTKGKLEGAKTLLRSKEQERSSMEDILKDRVATVFEHTPAGSGLDGINSSYTEGQKRTFNEIQEMLKQLLRIDREHGIFMRDYYQAENDYQNLQQRIDDDENAAEIDLGAIDAEFGTIRQMAKMSIGRQGNHFPVLTAEYFHCGPNEVGMRENIISLLRRIESIDPEAFCRYHKNKLNRIPPLVLLIPTYGEFGFCWEPFDRFNRATSPGRIVIPMYPRNVYVTVLTAIADLRWQVAKEKASYYWMEEGLTGHYYQWYLAQKLKGDIKEYFIQDYIMWITKEAEGIQKLPKEVRGSFWRFMPFAQEVKEKLKTRNLVYQELYQRDLNRAMSDGY